MILAQIEATRDILTVLLESDGGRLVLLVAILSLFISMASLYVLNRQTSATSKATEALNAKVERDAEQTASIAQLMLGIHDIARSIKSQTEQNERALKIAVATQEEERETRAAVASLNEDIDLQLNALREHITATGDGNTRRLLQRMDDLFSRFASASALAKQHFMKSLDESTRLLGEVERAKLAILQEIGHSVGQRSAGDRQRICPGQYRCRAGIGCCHRQRLSDRVRCVRGSTGARNTVSTGDGHRWNLGLSGCTSMA